MANFRLGLRAMLRVWQDSAFSNQVRALLEPTSSTPPAKASVAAREVVPIKPAPRRNDALTLLTVLQREARFVDFIKEPITSYSDAQIGAAVRDVHKNSGAALDRLFGLQPLAAQAEGAEIDVPRGFDPVVYQLIGNIRNEPPFRGKLCHHGWKASKCELPDWTGSDASAWVVAPMEVELK